jgi:hypothetical protein
VPQTVAQFGFTTIALAIGLLATYFALRRWGTDDTSDTLVVLWRRWAGLGNAKPVQRRASVPKAKTPKPAPPRKGPSQKILASNTVAPSRRRPRIVKSEARDHVPLSTAKPASADDAVEPKLAFRHRFRRGLRKTREKLGA